ncbi:hypothetical protein CAPTEDRAFT_215292 [Capitella teleta]|uniref:SOCS box domain-containing protein n=1 Tax=Capitella teleta TaxID=283909 RepID=R7VF75_CAPTE|nr:hypothetical protein CAPTEDRAFT_215292 [Capitella teleta]|eukprot:ELU17508.1 hypothetical protein CAPTEDRAFT_215292 [Capitella teleta]
MGADQSSVGPAPQRNPAQTFSRSITRAKAAKECRHSAWSKVHTCTYSQWLRGHSNVFGFDHKHLKNEKDSVLHNIQPYCTRGYQFSIEKLEEQATNRGLQAAVELRGTPCYPAHAPSVSIIGYQRHIAILQVLYKKTKEVHFIAIDLKSGQHLSVYKDIYINGPCIYEAYLSPDESLYLLRPNFFFAYSRCSDPFTTFAITKDIQVISIMDYESKVINVIEDISSLWLSVAFHPLSGHSMVALGNYTVDENTHQVSLFDLDKMKVAVCSEPYPSVVCHHLTFNPTGTLLVSYGVRLVWPRVDLILPDTVFFFSPDDFTLLKVINTGSVSVNHLQASLSPLFSKTGEFMALTGPQGDVISIYKMPAETSLRHLCRLKILHHFPDDVIPQLPLPQKLKNFILCLPHLNVLHGYQDNNAPFSGRNFDIYNK